MAKDRGKPGEVIGKIGHSGYLTKGSDSGSERTEMKPGGNYTQPVYDPVTEITTYEVYVNWQLVAIEEDDVTATEKLREKLNGRHVV